ncbi:hypothetical protein B9Z55_028825 [Caenorhabditis nigoni]|uniref:Uncharacterized protein n=1 Tax=Caenorhabditis nigoni TaxID=1611254 RepID=A0A2G5SA88_9PELO|nr:hypothetical protein B9Z55_028825 [Caenorhabditis nigoni]
MSLQSLQPGHASGHAYPDSPYIIEKRLKRLERKCNCSLEVLQERGFQEHYSIHIEGDEDANDLEKVYEVIDKVLFKLMDKEYERSESPEHYWYLFSAEIRNVEGFGRKLYELGNCLGIYAYQHGKHVSTPIHFVGSPDQLRGIREISEWTVARLTVRNVEIDGCKELETIGNSEESVEITYFKDFEREWRAMAFNYFSIFVIPDD